MNTENDSQYRFAGLFPEKKIAQILAESKTSRTRYDPVYKCDEDEKGEMVADFSCRGTKSYYCGYTELNVSLLYLYSRIWLRPLHRLTFFVL